MKKDDVTLAEKRKLAADGKVLDPDAVEFAAIKALGKKNYRKRLVERFGCSQSLVSKAFNNEAPYLLLQIHLFISSGANENNSNAEVNTGNTVNNQL